LGDALVFVKVVPALKNLPRAGARSQLSIARIARPSRAKI